MAELRNEIETSMAKRLCPTHGYYQARSLSRLQQSPLQRTRQTLEAQEHGPSTEPKPNAATATAANAAA